MEKQLEARAPVAEVVPAEVVVPPPPPAADIAGQLQQLSDLKAAGALTDSEFAEAKAKVLQGGAR